MQFGMVDDNLDADKSSFETELEIKFIGKEVPKFIYNGSQEADFDLESIPGDETESLSEFEEAETDDTMSVHKEEFSKDDANDSANKPPQSDSFVDKIKESAPRMVADALEERLPKVLSGTFKTILPDLLNNSVKKALPKEQIVDLQKKLTKAIKTTLDKYVQRNVRKGSKVVSELIKYCVMKLDKADVNLCELVDLIRDLVILIDSSLASVKSATKEDKMST
ncbi:hypothetical protein Tco_0966006 [Tanacetum coccineum]